MANFFVTAKKYTDIMLLINLLGKVTPNYKLSSTLSLEDLKSSFQFGLCVILSDAESLFSPKI